MASVTIYDVAAQAGVSIKTVSRAMNGERNVSAATQERVRAAAQALGYSPSLSARSLAGARSFVIAVFTDARLTADHWRDGGGEDLARLQLGAGDQCRRTGHHLLVEPVGHGPVQARAEVKALLGALKPAGVILAAPVSDDPAVLDVLDKSETPYVRLAAGAPDGGGLRMATRDREAARAMTERLLALGHRRLGVVVGEPRLGASRARLEGFLEAMAAQDLTPPDAFIQHGDGGFRSGAEAAKLMLAEIERPTAIFASSDEMAAGCMAAAADRGFAAPSDISIAGFGDGAAARVCRPQLTTVRLPLAAMAAEAARRLIGGEVVAGRGGEVPQDLFAAFELVERASIGPRRR